MNSSDKYIKLPITRFIKHGGKKIKKQEKSTIYKKGDKMKRLIIACLLLMVCMVYANPYPSISGYTYVNHTKTNGVVVTAKHLGTGRLWIATSQNWGWGDGYYSLLSLPDTMLFGDYEVRGNYQGFLSPIYTLHNFPENRTVDIYIVKPVSGD